MDKTFRVGEEAMPTEYSKIEKMNSTMKSAFDYGKDAGSSDRLIHSIAMIKDILMSNMQLREDLLKISGQHDFTIQENYQLKIENEDLRDRLHLVSGETSQIEYQAYLPVLDFEEMINNSQYLGDLQAAKSIILTYIFSMKKENRNLHRRLNDRMLDNVGLTGGPCMDEYRKPEDLEENFTEYRSMLERVTVR